MSYFLILISIIWTSLYCEARSSALDDYWTEQNKIDRITSHEPDGLTIVLTKPSSFNDQKSKIKNRTKTKVAQQTKIIIKKDKKTKKTKQIEFFVDNKNTKKQEFVRNRVTTFFTEPRHKKQIVVEKTRLGKKKMLVRHGVLVANLTSKEKPTKSKVSAQVSSSNRVNLPTQVRQPSQIDWMIQQEINDAQNEYTEFQDAMTDQLNCGKNRYSHLMDLPAYFRKIKNSDLNNQSLMTNFGVQFDKNCLNAFGQNFPNMVKDAVTEGLQCLDRLDGAASDFHQMMIVDDLQNNDQPLKLNCKINNHTQSFQAEATIFPDEKNFPEIQLEKGTDAVSDSRIKEVIFHELLHTKGYAHQVDIEYMYACQSCCRDQNIDKASCQICKKNYHSISDPEYRQDVLAWINESRAQGASIMAYISTMDITQSSVHQDILQLTKLIKQNSDFAHLNTLIDRELNQGNKMNSKNLNLDEKLAKSMVAISKGDMAKGRQLLSAIHASISNKNLRHQENQFANKQTQMLFQQLNSQFNMVNR